MRCAYNLPVEEDLKPHIHKHDPLGHYFARAVLACNIHSYASQSLSRVFNASLQHDVPLALVDAAYTDVNGYLLSSDELASGLAKDLYDGLDLAKNCVSITPDAADNKGAVIRNAVMAHRLVHKAEEHKADTIVMNTGLAHLGGDTLHDLSYNTSLTAFLRQKIRPQDKILPVVFPLKRDETPIENHIPSAFWENNPHTFFPRGFSKNLYYAIGVGNSEEDDFIAALGRSYGNESPARFDLPAYPHWVSTRQKLQELIADARAHPTPPAL